MTETPEEACQTKAVEEPQGEKEGIWATVKEYKRIKQSVKKRLIYKYVEKGYFESKITSTNRKQKRILIFIKEAQDVANILYLRELKKNAPKPEPKPRIRLRTYHMKLAFPDLNPKQIELFISVANNPSLIGERCDRIDFAYDKDIEVDEDTYKKIIAKAKEHGMKSKNMMTSVVYHMMLEKLLNDFEQLQSNKEAAK
ncbi:MAG: hypothetical protein NTX75_01765 [Proteobacteria bacterium]|nr:hypothetical protein [Pseudomonadota bacterium]